MRKKWWKIVWQERSRDAVVRELKEELWERISIELLKDYWYIITDKTWRLAQKWIKQRIFSVLIGWEIELDPNEIEWIWYYPLDNQHQKIREKLEENMDEFAKEVLKKLRQELYDDFHDVKDIELPQNATQKFDQILKSMRSRISVLLRW